MKTINPDTALILVDVQHDFLPGGALAVPQGDEILPIIAALQPQFDHIVATQECPKPCRPRRRRHSRCGFGTARDAIVLYHARYSIRTARGRIPAWGAGGSPLGGA